MAEIIPVAIREIDAARMIGVSVAALRRWRRERRGPAFVKLERCIRYRVTDLVQFLDDNAVGVAQPASASVSERPQ
jgi:hypothetical protein